MATIRTFIALDLPLDAREAVRRLQGELAPTAHGVRWVDHSTLHLTLAFLGDVDDQAHDELGRTLQSAVAGLPRFRLTIQGLGVFPRAISPRVVWVGLQGEGLKELQLLQSRVVAAARSASVPPTDDRFSPHITIGRVKRPPGPNLTPILDSYRVWHGGELQVDEVVLFRSDLNTVGPVYTPLSRAPLGPPAPDQHPEMPT